MSPLGELRTSRNASNRLMWCYGARPRSDQRPEAAVEIRQNKPREAHNLHTHRAMMEAKSLWQMARSWSVKFRTSRPVSEMDDIIILAASTCTSVAGRGDRGRPTSTTGQILPKPSLLPMEPYLISVTLSSGRAKACPGTNLLRIQTLFACDTETKALPVAGGPSSRSTKFHPSLRARRDNIIPRRGGTDVANGAIGSGWIRIY
jgi:hypothetical protein